MNSPALPLDLDRVERHLAADPGNRHLLASAIDLALESGQLEAARKHVDAAVARFPDDPFFSNRHGNVLLAEKRFDEAAAVFASLLSGMADVNLAYNLAYAHFRQGRHAQAREALEPFMASDDAPVHGVTLFLRVSHHLQEIEPAVAVAQRHAARCGGDADFLATASLLYLDAGQLEAARQASEAALALGKRPVEALVAAGSMALARDDAAGAASLFDEALRANPADGRSWSGLGTASLLRNDLDAARSQLERAVANMPGHIGTWHLLGWCQIMRRELPEAQQSFQRSLDLDRNFGESHGGMAVVHALAGRKSEAEASLERAQRLDRQGLSAVFAQMVLSGVAADPARFRQLAMKVLSRRAAPGGGTLADALAKHAPP